MLDLLSRVLLHPIDYAPGLHRHQVRFIAQREIAPSVHAFQFEKPDQLSWRAGQHGVFKLSGVSSGSTWRPFSIASSPHEGVIEIATTIPELHSAFKATLRDLTPGSAVTLFGPFGEFHAPRTPEPIIAVAGGIGITPLRALAYEVAQGHLDTQTLHLIYAAPTVYTYEAELRAWSAMSPQLTIEWVRTPEEVHAALRTQFALHGSGATYALSGAPKMIEALRSFCRELGATHIMNDPFRGY